MEALKSKLNTKWVSTAASIWIQCTSGSLYTFSVYSPTLKSTQNYDQSTLDTVSVFKDIGVNCGVLSGLLYTLATDDHRNRTGPWVVLLAGALQNFVGYFFIWAAVVGLIPPPPVAVMCLFMLVAAHGQSFFNTANAVTSVWNFPYYRGTAVGVMKGFLGLSGAILIQIYETLFNDKPASFLLMLALLSTIVPLLLMGLVRIYGNNEGDEKRNLDSFSYVAMLLAAYLLVIIILKGILSFPSWARVLAFVVLLMILASPAYIAFGAANQGSARIPECSVHVRDRLLDSSRSDADQGSDSNGSRNFLSAQDLNLLQAIGAVEFWILFFAMACGMGSGLAVINNLGQIGGSFGFSNIEIDTLVSLWSIWNFLGRFGAGYVSDYFLHLKGWARPLFMVITLATMSLGLAVVASGLPAALYVGSVLVGVCYGSQWSLMPTITSELFGVRHMGTIYNTITIANPVGSYIFSVRIVGYFYDKEAAGEGNTCVGVHCFLLSFLIMASVTLIGSLAALVLFFRKRDFYSQVIVRRIRCSARE